jgi:hypothetical protein
MAALKDLEGRGFPTPGIDIAKAFFVVNTIENYS